MSDLGVRDDQAIKERIRAAADDVEAHREAFHLACELRDELVIEALEAEFPTRDVARWARLSQSRVTAILASH